MGILPEETARQIISQTHTVNGEVVNIPSYHLKPGDKVAVRENQIFEAIERSLSNCYVYEWITWNNDMKVLCSCTCKITNSRNIKEQLIVELNNK
jgi:small subunit ribosomal protein S4